MNKEQILKGIIECINSTDLEGLSENVDLLLDQLSDLEASREFSDLFENQYTSFKGPYLAKMMEIILRKRPNLALVSYPDNYFFRLVLITGSIDLYECFMEEAVVPFLKNKSLDVQEKYYRNLLGRAKVAVQASFFEFTACDKGLDYNGAFATAENNPDVLLINRDDYEVMEGTMEDYNTIIGRWAIMDDLKKRAGVEKNIN